MKELDLFNLLLIDWQGSGGQGTHDGRLVPTSELDIYKVGDLVKDPYAKSLWRTQQAWTTGKKNTMPLQRYKPQAEQEHSSKQGCF